MTKLVDNDLLNKSKGVTFDRAKYHKITPEHYGITEYKWNKETGLLDCYQNVNLLKTPSLVRMPFKFGEIHGNFGINIPDIKINNTVFESFKDGPRKVFGDLYYDNLGLVTMEHFPEIVTGGIRVIGNNNFKSFKGCPQKITKFHIGNIRIPDLVYGPKECDRYIISCLPDMLEYYPVCIINFLFIDQVTNNSIREERWKLSENFQTITQLVKSNVEIFRPLLDDKVKFHQQVMRMKPELIPYYTTIKPPSNKTII